MTEAFRRAVLRLFARRELFDEDNVALRAPAYWSGAFGAQCGPNAVRRPKHQPAERPAGRPATRARRPTDHAWTARGVVAPWPMPRYVLTTPIRISIATRVEGGSIMKLSKLLTPMLVLLLMGGNVFVPELTHTAGAQPTVRTADAATHWSRWKGEFGLGYAQSEGPISDAFAWGVDVSLGVSRLLGSRVFLESGFSAVMAPLANASVIGEACIVGIIVTCDDAKEAGYFISMPFGLSLPIRLGSGGRSLEVGGGVLYQMYGVSNVGGYGTRDGVGPYGRLALDLTHSLGGSPIVLGLVLKASRTSTSGASFGDRVTSSKTGDTWITIGVSAYNR